MPDKRYEEGWSPARTVYDGPREKKESQNLGGKIVSVEWTDSKEQFLKENWNTMTDAEIGEEIGKSPNAVGARRRELGLYKNPRGVSKQYNRKVSDDEVKKLHSRGLSDPEIAERLGVCRSTICRRRKKLGLEPNISPVTQKITDEELREAHNQGLDDLEIAQRYGVVRSTVSRRRRSLGLEPNAPSNSSAGNISRKDSASSPDTHREVENERKPPHDLGEDYTNECEACHKPIPDDRRFCMACGGFRDSLMGVGSGAVSEVSI